MKRVGVITFHDVLNYGATLQAYALCMALKSWGYEAEVINYQNPKMRAERTLWYSFKHSKGFADKLLALLRICQRRKMQVVFDEFLQNHLPLSGSRIMTKKELHYVSSRYDSVIAGSDQVFNYIGTGEDFAFYLDDIEQGVRRIAYAPSFGLREIDDFHRQHVAMSLNRFDALSAREDIGIEIIYRLTGISPPMVVDPTFLLDEQQWSKLAKFSKIKQPYVLLYSFGSTELEDVACQKAKDIGGKVVNINRILPDLSKRVLRLVSPSPAEFIGLIKRAEYVVTNSFHGMALSINFQKQFTLYVNDYENSANTNLRFFSLAKRLNLEKNIRTKGQPLSESFINYNLVKSYLDYWKTESRNYLEKAINGE